MKSYLLSQLTLLLLVASSTLNAQVSVELRVDEEQVLAKEPLIVRVRITNLSGAPFKLGTEPDWVSFTITDGEGSAVETRQPIDLLGEFTVESGTTTTRRLDIAPGYELTKPGRYSIEGTLRIKQWDVIKEARPVSVEISSGNIIWNQEIGIPNGDQKPDVRRYELVTSNQRRGLRLYARLYDPTARNVIAVEYISKVLAFDQPQAQVDDRRNLHILSLDDARTYRHCVMSPRGRLILREFYRASTVRPSFKYDEDGILVVSGAVRFDPDDTETKEP